MINRIFFLLASLFIIIGSQCFSLNKSTIKANIEKSVEKQESVKEIKEAFKKENAKKELIGALFNYVEIIQDLPEKQYFPLFDTFILESNNYFFVSKKRASKTYKMIEELFCSNIKSSTPNIALFLTKAHDSITMDFYKKNNLLVAFLPKDVFLNLSDNHFKNLCLHSMILNLSTKTLNSSSAFIKNIKELSSTLAITTVRVGLLLSSTYYAPKITRGLILGSITFFISCALLFSHLKNLDQFQEKEADAVCAKFQDPQNLISFFNSIQNFIESEFEDYEKENKNLRNSLNELETQFPEKINELKTFSTVMLTTKQQVKNYLLGGEGTHPSFENRIMWLKDKQVKQNKIEQTYHIKKEISHFLKNFDTQVNQGKTPEQRKATTTSQITEIVHEIFAQESMDTKHAFIQKLCQTWPLWSALNKGHDIELIPLGSSQAPKLLESFEKLQTTMNLKKDFKLMILRGKPVVNATVFNLELSKKNFGVVIFTEECLQIMSDREIMGVIGHELAHTKCKHIQKHNKTAWKYIGLSSVAFLAVFGICVTTDVGQIILQALLS